MQWVDVRTDSSKSNNSDPIRCNWQTIARYDIFWYIAFINFSHDFLQKCESDDFSLGAYQLSFINFAKCWSNLCDENLKIFLHEAGIAFHCQTHAEIFKIVVISRRKFKIDDSTSKDAANQTQFARKRKQIIKVQCPISLELTEQKNAPAATKILSKAIDSDSDAWQNGFGNSGEELQSLNSSKKRE